MVSDKFKLHSKNAKNFANSEIHQHKVDTILAVSESSVFLRI